MSLFVDIQKQLDGFALAARFEVGQGAAAVLGASGCGKSMTLRCIAGVQRPDKGRIVLNGRVLFDSAAGIDLPPQRRGVGLLFQSYALFPHMTVEQNLLCALPATQSRAQRRQACAQMLQAMRLQGLAQRLPAALSGGQQQRVALARMLLAKPALLLLDEPFSALDSFLREEVEGEVGRLLAQFAGPALLVTHNRDEAYRLCPQLVVMEQGRVLRAGATRAVFADPQYVAAARLTGCKNILPCTPAGPYTVRLAGWGLPLQLAAPVPPGCCAVGIRAHDLAPCGPQAQNALPVRLLHCSENPFDWNLIFAGTQPGAQLWWKVPKATLAAARPAAPAYLAAAPGCVMPLV